jgi:hypothetical protein
MNKWRRKLMTYEQYEAYIGAAIEKGFGLTLDQMRMWYAYYIAPCPCEPENHYPNCRGWILRRNIEMSKDIGTDGEAAILFGGDA